MAYSNDDLNNYLSKLQDIIKKKQDNYLEAEDLEAAAEALGFSRGDLAEIKKDFQTRGEQHLKHKNWGEAQKEFEQLIFLDPKNAEAYLGLAKVHLQYWKRSRQEDVKNKALEYAHKSIDLDPEQKAAYQLINQLKQKPRSNQRAKAKTTPAQKSKRIPKSRRQRSTKVGSRLFILQLSLGILGVILTYLFLYRSHIFKAVSEQSIRVTDLILLQDKQKPLLWVGSRDYYGQATLVQIIDLNTRDQPKTFRIEETINALRPFGQTVYYSFDRGFTGREFLNGEVVDNQDVLIHKYSELQVGIGQITCNYACNLMNLTLKNGDSFIYNPESNTLLSMEDYKAISSQQAFRSTKAYPFELHKYPSTEVYQWQVDAKENLNSFFLFKKKVPEILKGINARLGWEFQQLNSGSPGFLKGRLLYQDKDLALGIQQA
ncbi:MAG: hypothetical protein AAFU64_09515 [Bacteroidota bacterium]